MRETERERECESEKEREKKKERERERERERVWREGGRERVPLLWHYTFIVHINILSQSTCKTASPRPAAAAVAAPQNILW